MRLRETAVNLVNLFVGVVEVGLGLRFIFKLFGANAANGFVSWTYEMTNGLLDPFRNIFHNHVFASNYVLDFNTLFAMLVYALLGLLALSLVGRWSD
jgi:hypothetical protein